jgi:long-subunit fatty acid transport protein
MHRYFTGLFFLMLMSGVGSLSAQEASPYSRFGLGYMPQDAMSATRAMGDISAGYSSAFHLNHANPASYADLGLTTFEVGANANVVSIRTADSIYHGVNGTVSHIALGIPLIRGKWGMSFGLLPYSFVNYSIATTQVDTSQAYTGKGSLYQAYLGTAYKIKDFSIGINAGYVFGSIDYTRGYVFPDSIQAYNIQNLSTTRVYGFIYNVGIQYRHRIMHKTTQNTLKSDVFFTIGAQGTSNVNLNTRVSSMWERYTGTSPEVVIDTPLNYADKIGKITMPYNFSAGFTVGNENWWLVGADFKYTGWSQFSNPNAALPLKLSQDGPYWSYGDSWRASVGVGIVPDYDNTRNYFSRIQYKIGGYYSMSELQYHASATAPGQHLSDYGATLGLSVPILISGIYREAAHFHFSTEIGTYTPGVKDLIATTYYRFNFGFTLSNVWFVKRKFD